MVLQLSKPSTPCSSVHNVFAKKGDKIAQRHLIKLKYKLQVIASKVNRTRSAIKTSCTSFRVGEQLILFPDSARRHISKNDRGHGM